MILLLDTDVLTLRRQYDNLDLLEHSRLSNSAEDLSQLENHLNYPFDLFEQLPDEMEEGKENVSFLTTFSLFSIKRRRPI